MDSVNTMQILGKIEDVQGTKVTLEVRPWSIPRLAKLMDGKEYSIGFEKKPDKKTDQQRKFLWALIHEIGVEQSGRPDNDWDVYCQALERANVKFEFIAVKPEAENFLRRQFRAVQKIEEMGQFNLYKIFVGCSQMTKKEMSLLIDTVLDMAEEVGLDTLYWQGVLK